MFATSSRYSTACADAAVRSSVARPITAAVPRRSRLMNPPDLMRSAARDSMPSRPRGARTKGPEQATAGRDGRGLAVDVFAGRGRGGNGGVPLLPQEHLPEADRPTLERCRRAGQIQAPRAVDLLAHEGARLVGAGLAPLHPPAARACVVAAAILR